MVLNPLAQSFQPGTPYSQETLTKNQPPAKDNEETECFADILDLPREVICLMLAKVGSIQDLLACAISNKQLCSLICTTALSIDLSTQFEAKDRFAQSHVALPIAQLEKYTPGLMQLDLTGLSVENEDIVQLMLRFHSLRVLNLSSCKALTPQIVSAFTSTHSSEASTVPLSSNSSTPDSAGDILSPSSPGHLSLEALSLQRCFQLNSSVLSTLLTACSIGALPLTTLALSHLDLSTWEACTAHVPTKPMPEQPMPTTCANTAHAQAQRMPDHSACPNNSRASTDANTASTDISSVASCSRSLSTRSSFSGNPQSPLRVVVLNNCTNLTSKGLLSLAECCPKLEMLFLGGSHVAACSAHIELEEVEDALGAGSVAECVAGVLRELQPSSSVRGLNAARSRYAADWAACLAVLALSSPELRILETTFMPQVVLDLLGSLLDVCFSRTGRTQPLLWNFCNLSSIRAARSCLRMSLAKDPLTWASEGITGTPYPATDGPSTALALRCAVNGSSGSRWTPLHFAALGDADALADLIALGATVNTRNSGGATPLFLACECGKDEQIAELLLEAGAYALMNNSAGESPLYISSLRGHTAMVKVLLKHFSKHKMDWQSPSLYSDGWTPLMAACVADRYDVALLLLLAAGSHAAAMVKHVNKYGQSVFHIAARKASQRLLQLLLSFSNSAAVVVQDLSGETPIDVARKNRHQIAEQEFHQAYALACLSS
eukprot:gene30503-35523_t